ncbi:DUF2026 family protein [Citromicrobium bathyomarinum]|uniref:DUF2026 family protein n=1 Tax=Alteriqipengyuania lutimaris TaxID=1538146 RepID=UPI001CFD8760|nr:DUF2026 family protein [Alteriqipengyuania lutimaris]
MARKFALTLGEFNRIYQVIHGTIASETRAEKGCVFFAIAGAYILETHFGIRAKPVAGGFVLRISKDAECIGYAKEVDGAWSWGDDAFHMWVQTDEHVIDFMSPIYQEAFAEAEPKVAIPRRMFQKRFDLEAQNPNDLECLGDFFTFPDPDLSAELGNVFLEQLGNSDLVEIAERWFGSRRRKQRPSIRMAASDGAIVDLKLPSTVATSAW